MTRLWLLVAMPTALGAQGWRADLDVGMRTVAFRGVQLDSIDRTLLGPGASPLTPDGYAVFCLTGTNRCTYYRPGAVVHATPFSARFTGDAWGVGVRGLRVHLHARYVEDLAGEGAWPLATPRLWATEGYLELARRSLTLRAGRTTMVSRLGWQGLDGAHAEVRLARGRLGAGAWGGWGLAEGVAQPVTSPALNPLDEYQPRDRQLVAGADLSWRLPRVRGRIVYQREVDPAVNYFISERAAGDVDLRVARWASVNVGGGYDLAAGEWGSADAAVGVRAPRGIRLTVGARRYRPYFPLWTVWGAFSPSPYHAAFGAVDLPLDRDLTAWVRGERYIFGTSDAATPLVRVEDRGWRWSGGASWVPVPSVRIEGSAHGAFGPGAAALGFDGLLGGRVRPNLDVTFRFGRLVRPLELRYDEVDLWQAGGDVHWRLAERVAVTGGLTFVAEARERPDAAAFTR